MILKLLGIDKLHKQIQELSDRLVIVETKLFPFENRKKSGWPKGKPRKIKETNGTK